MSLNDEYSCVTELVDYINHVFSELEIGSKWNDINKLPMFLQLDYHYIEAKLLGNHCLLMLDIKHDKKISPSTIKKHIKTISKIYNNEIIYITPNISSYMRTQLIKERISFIVPYKQMYLPSFAIDFRESFKNKKNNNLSKLSTFAQIILLKEIYSNDSSPIKVTNLLKEFNFSRMSISRAYNELADSGLAILIPEGRKKLLNFKIHGRALWENASELMTSPVKKKIKINNHLFNSFSKNIFFKSGESALSFYSMLIEPKHRTYAIDSKIWDSLKNIFDIKEIVSDYKDEYSTDIEIWKYDPSFFANNGVVDPLSLILSLCNVTDDRIEIEIENLLDKTLEDN